ncbi:MAG: hypothetical protein E7089_08405 [Bacteroidales bacterium]|nr:hypothetical protein [Bacteroidales bacterium]
MKRLFHYIILLLFGCHISSVAQTYDASAWMARISDEQKVSSLSIPGTHDAATGEGLYFSAALGVTQTLTIGEQWECGVRAFDLRPAVNDTTLHIYHGSLKTKISFSQALDTLLHKLSKNPTEFAIVLMREESDSEDDSEKALWPSAIGKIIKGLGDKAVTFTPQTTVGNLRGKILFLSRTAYRGTNKGAFVKGWSHSKDGTTNGQIISYNDGSVARLQIQDFYAPTTDEKRIDKQNAITKYLSSADKAPAGVWSINFTSGYSATLFGKAATTAGYKQNAAEQHPSALEQLSKNSYKHLGIIFMDFAGADKVKGNILHWSSYNVQGKKLLKAIIDSNFQ